MRQDRLVAEGVIREWYDEDGWGVIDSVDTPGGCWTHFSHLDMDGYRSAQPGQAVTFTWEHAQQDGFACRAVTVHLEGVPPRSAPPSSAPGSYGSRLEITPDPPAS